jgi:ribosome recycling factor
MKFIINKQARHLLNVAPVNTQPKRLIVIAPSNRKAKEIIKGRIIPNDLQFNMGNKRI